MPPENMQGDVDPQCSLLAWDVFSLGVLIWAMWYRTEPWENCAPFKIIRLVSKGKRPQMGTNEANAAPIELQAIIVSMWQSDAASRPSVQSALGAFMRTVWPALHTDSSFADWGKYAPKTSRHSPPLPLAPEPKRRAQTVDFSKEADPTPKSSRRRTWLVSSVTAPPPMLAAPPSRPDGWS